MSSTTKEYRVILKNESGEEQHITHDHDYHPLTLDAAQKFADSRRRHAEHFKNTEIRLEAREIIVGDWREIK